MGKIFKVIGICSLVGSFIAFTSCDDEDENKGNVNSSESKLVFEGDTFRIPAKVNQIDSLTYEFQDATQITYEFQDADKEKILNSLFEQSAKLSEYGNFDLDRGKKPFEYGKTKLEDATLETSKANGMWSYVGTKGDNVNTIKFDSIKAIITIHNITCQLDSTGVMQGPNIGLSVDYDFEKLSK